MKNLHIKISVFMPELKIRVCSLLLTVNKRRTYWKEKNKITTILFVVSKNEQKENKVITANYSSFKFLSFKIYNIVFILFAIAFAIINNKKILVLGSDMETLILEIKIFQSLIWEFCCLKAHFIKYFSYCIILNL